MTEDPIAVVRALLDAPTDRDTVNRLVAEDATYVSLNEHDPGLKKLMPWCGVGHGPQGILETFVRVGRF